MVRKLIKRTFFNIPKLLIICLISIQIIAGQDGTKACFLVGNTPLPKIVENEIDKRVRCDPTSEVDFQKGRGVSSVRFALDNFKVSGTGEDLARFKKLHAVYGAMNAALRSKGGSNQTSLKALKGADFFIEFQLRILEGDINGRQGAQHKLQKANIAPLTQKVLKNCLGCTKEDRQDVLAIAKKNGFGAPA
ncbi:expressed protein [Phakopsora pachyrhizi]|uniref:Expressed protein n=1 Tax=Phakopsora pachyrhizi TaxID=170000 RepID=A0AAV0AK89_PHAPC|nr:expressed protein [Phakopsora pachyrhizi]